MGYSNFLVIFLCVNTLGANAQLADFRLLVVSTVTQYIPVIYPFQLFHISLRNNILNYSLYTKAPETHIA